MLSTGGDPGGMGGNVYHLLIVVEEMYNIHQISNIVVI